MTVRVVATLEPHPHEVAAMETYFGTAMPLLEDAGGKVIEQFDVSHAVVGQMVGTMIMIIEYPTSKLSTPFLAQRRTRP